MQTEHEHQNHIYVNHVKHFVHAHELSDSAIKALADVPNDHILCLDTGHTPDEENPCKDHPRELQVIEDDECIHIKSDMRFYSHATGCHPVTVTIDRKEYAFDRAKQTGKSIKERAGVPLTDVLFLQEPKEDRVITDEECIILKCGDCFHSAPPANYGHTNAEQLPAGLEGGTVLPQPDGWKFVIFDDYVLPDGFSAKSIRLLIKLAPTFPDAAPDMFWVMPQLLTSSNAVPQGSSVESVLGEQWQRFSWHLQPGAWKVGVSTLRDFLRCVRVRFEKRN
jgi:hypothetical protein